MKVYLVQVFYNNQREGNENFTATHVEKAFSTKEKATEYIMNWHPYDDGDDIKVMEKPEFVSEVDIRVVEVEDSGNPDIGLYYFSVKEMEVK